MICGIDWAKGDDLTSIVFIDTSKYQFVVTKSLVLTREETAALKETLKSNKGWEHA